MPALADLELAFTDTERLLRGVATDQWAAPTPCAGWTVRDLANHTTWVVEMMGAATANAPAPNAPDTDILGPDPAATFARAAATSLAAWEARELSGMMPLPFGEFPAAVAFSINLLDTNVHAWDLARATGQPFELDADVSAEMLVFARTIPPTIARGIFDAPVDIAPDASTADQLVAFLGRQP